MIIDKLIYDNIVKILTVYKQTSIKKYGLASKIDIDICVEINKLTTLIEEKEKEE